MQMWSRNTLELGWGAGGDLPALRLPLSHTHPHSLSLTQILTPPLAHTTSLPLSHTHPHSLSHTHTLIPPLSHTPSLPFSHTHPHSLSHTHTLTPSLDQVVACRLALALPRQTAKKQSPTGWSMARSSKVILPNAVDFRAKYGHVTP